MSFATVETSELLTVSPVPAPPVTTSSREPFDSLTLSLTMVCGLGVEAFSSWSEILSPHSSRKSATAAPDDREKSHEIVFDPWSVGMTGSEVGMDELGAGLL